MIIKKRRSMGITESQSIEFAVNLGWIKLKGKGWFLTTKGKQKLKDFENINWRKIMDRRNYFKRIEEIYGRDRAIKKTARGKTAVFCKIRYDQKRAWRECRLRFFTIGIHRMDVGFNLFLPNNLYVGKIRVPFGKWLNRKKYIKQRDLIESFNKEDGLTGFYATLLDEYGHAI